MTAAQLKASILDLAIRGQLVPQDPNDEPADALLARIGRVKGRGEGDQWNCSPRGRARTPAAPLTIPDEDKPFALPAGWEWVRLGDICRFAAGKTPPRGDMRYWGKDIPWLSIADMNGEGVTSSTKEYVSNLSICEVFAGRIVPRGTLLMSFKLTVGRTTILGMDAVHNEAIINIQPILEETREAMYPYLKYVLPVVSVLGDSKDAIKGKTLNKDSLNRLPIPLPPLAEQKRIVAKIEELLPLVGKVQSSAGKA